MLDDNNLVTYEMSPEWFAVESARRLQRRMSEAIDRGDLRLWTAMCPASNSTGYSIVREEA